MDNAVSMINSHSETLVEARGERWQPVPLPKHGEDRTAFHAFMLLPGLSISFYTAILGRSRSSVSSYRAAAIEAARSDPMVMTIMHATIQGIRAEHGLQMAQLRGKGQLPSWSRLAIGEYSKRGHSRGEIALAFQCSRSTVANVLQGKGTAYSLFSGSRRLTRSQQDPPGKWQGSRGIN